MLHIAITGAGSVASANPLFTCAAACDQSVAAGTAIHLVASPAQGSFFSSWQGVCSGHGACDFTMNTDADLTATFALLPPADVHISVSLTGPGTGRVVSTPAGINCPGTCSMTVQSGSAVSLAQQAASNSVFVGWGTGCSGAGGCSLTATADVTVWANFGISPCVTIAPPDAVTMQQYVTMDTQQEFLCFSGVADANGALAFQMDPLPGHMSEIDFVSSAGSFLRAQYFGSDYVPNLILQPRGFAAVGGRGYLGPPNIIDLGRWDEAGNTLSEVWWGAQNYASAGDPSSGVLVAGDLTPNTQSALQHEAVMFSGGGEQLSVKWSQPLASAGAVFGAGVDVLGRSLVITAGTSGSISAEWFDRGGAPLTGEFTLLASFTPGQSTWFETSPVIGGGLEVRRMDAAPFAAQALVVLQSGSTTVQPAPAWMTARPNTNLQIARQGSAYAVLPYGASGVACTQTIEVVAPDGTSCSSRDYPIATGTCDTHGITLGADGSVIQQLPLSMEKVIQTQMGSWHTCTWRWWSGALR